MDFARSVLRCIGGADLSIRMGFGPGVMFDNSGRWKQINQAIYDADEFLEMPGPKYGASKDEKEEWIRTMLLGIQTVRAIRRALVTFSEVYLMGGRGI